MKKIKAVIMVVILLAILAVVAWELREQTTSNGWDRGTWSYDPSK